MEADLQAQVAFYLTGKKLTADLEAVAGLGLRPALFAGYRDLTRLRYDYPLVLIDRVEGECIAPLSGLIDAILDKVARGEAGERIRKHVLCLEQAIRAQIADGAGGLFSELWDIAAAPLIKDDELIADSLSRARANLDTDGELVDCNAATAGRIIGHAWRLAQKKRAQRFAKDIDRLQLRLSEILAADFINSSAGRSARTLSDSFGSGPMDNFDFDAMSHILAKSSRASLTDSRRARISGLLSTIQSQRFFPAHNASNEQSYAFAFDSCSAVLKAYSERLPETVKLAKAMAIARLEVNGEYSESRHDPLFETFGSNGLTADEIALFPDYLVSVSAQMLAGSELAALTEILAADLPIKILVQTDDVIEPSPVSSGSLAFSLRSRQLASMAMALNEVFVLQSPASGLYSLRDTIRRGLDYAGPALFSIFSGTGEGTIGFSPYLIGAAALEARIFPAMTFDPSAGDNWRARFSLRGNPQTETDWPLREFRYADELCQSVTQQIPFTLIDFVACDTRYASHFARVPRSRWSDSLVAVGDALIGNAQESSSQTDNVPCLTMIDGDDNLQKVIVDGKLVREARRCRSLWNSLQELAGIDNSHVDYALAEERQARAESEKSALAPPVATPASSPVAASEPASAAPTTTPIETVPDERSSDEAYIETPRCSTCNECVQLNGKMFVYDANRQAYIADVNAGTFAQLVEAAENCQVSIIHPGKPRNPDEPGLEDLIQRAALFV